MSVAKYVSQCRKWRLGSLVGYQIAMDKVTSDDTRLTFVTTGVLLMKLINEKNMNQYTHVILDEVRGCGLVGVASHVFVQVHERDKDTDFCLLLVMRLLRTNSRNVKVEQYMSQLHVTSPSPLSLSSSSLPLFRLF